MHKWQKDLFEKYCSSDTRTMTMAVGRQSGKSTISAQALKRLMDDMLNRPVENLILSEGTVYGSRYYCVEPVGGSWLTMEIWANDTFGSSSSDMWGSKHAPEPARRWYMNNRKFWFRDEKDRMQFVLRWS